MNGDKYDVTLICIRNDSMIWTTRVEFIQIDKPVRPSLLGDKVEAFVVPDMIMSITAKDFLWKGTIEELVKKLG